MIDQQELEQRVDALANENQWLHDEYDWLFEKLLNSKEEIKKLSKQRYILISRLLDACICSEEMKICPLSTYHCITCIDCWKRTIEESTNG